MRWARLIGFVLFFSQVSWNQQITVKSHKLANGMKLLIHEDHDIPNVGLYLFFQVGSNETPGPLGLLAFSSST